MATQKKTIQVTKELHEAMVKVLERGETFDDILRDFFGLERLSTPKGRPKLTAKQNGFE